jgi:hypothetical protein
MAAATSSNTLWSSASSENGLKNSPRRSAILAASSIAAERTAASTAAHCARAALEFQPLAHGLPSCLNNRCLFRSSVAAGMRLS